MTLLTEAEKAERVERNLQKLRGEHSKDQNIIPKKEPMFERKTDSIEAIEKRHGRKHLREQFLFELYSLRFPNRNRWALARKVGISTLEITVIIEVLLLDKIIDIKNINGVEQLVPLNKDSEGEELNQPTAYLDDLKRKMILFERIGSYDSHYLSVMVEFTNAIEEQINPPEPAPPLPEAAPELYRDRPNKSENPVEFCARIWGPWLNGEFGRKELRHFDPPLYQALAQWERRNGRSKLNIPTVTEINDRFILQSFIDPDPKVDIFSRNVSAMRKTRALKK